MGIVKSTTPYNMTSFCVLSHAMQRHAPSRAMIRAEHRSIQNINAGPRNAIASQATKCSKYVKLPAQGRDLAAVAQAAMLRNASCSISLQPLVEELMEFGITDER